MNTPEKIAQTYLRLNGFFTIPHFSILQDDWGHVDFLAVRLGGSVEKVGNADYRVPLKVDTDFLRIIGVTKRKSVGLAVEVKSGDEEVEVGDVAFDYVKPFFGKISKLIKVGFEEGGHEIHRRGDHVIVPLEHCLKFIKGRFEELDRIDQKLRGSGRLSKRGSWYLSEEFLSDLLFLKKSRFIGE